MVFTLFSPNIENTLWEETMFFDKVDLADSLISDASMLADALIILKVPASDTSELCYQSFS